jgi:hypothetical protein
MCWKCKNYHRNMGSMLNKLLKDITIRQDLKRGGMCKCMSKNGGRVVFVIFLGNSYDIKNMVKILGPREEGKYFSRIT